MVTTMRVFGKGNRDPNKKYVVAVQVSDYELEGDRRPTSPEAEHSWQNAYTLIGTIKEIAKHVDNCATVHVHARAVSNDRRLQYACVRPRSEKHEHKWARRPDDGTVYCSRCGIEKQ